MSASPGPSDPILELVKALARGEELDRVLAAIEPAAREAVAAVARASGERIRELEERQAQLESMLVDLRAVVRGYARIKRELREENEALGALDPARQPLIGAEGGLADVLHVVDKIADTPIAVLITGESGTGKEIIARRIHQRSSRADGPLVAINCAAIPEGLLESELFGIEKGTATGVGERAGKIAQANGGTLFLDEVADMSPAMQAKLLRVLQDHEIGRVGSTRTTKLDLRVVSATNHDLKLEVSERRFRQDLFYRLVGVHVHLPPLRERRGDIEKLLDHFLGETARRFRRNVQGFGPEARAALLAYRWPGNVRELIVEVERAVALAETDTVELAGLSAPIARPAQAGGPSEPAQHPGGALTLREARRRFERAFVEDVISRMESRNDAARVLGLTREGLRRRLQALGLAATTDEGGQG